MAFDRKTQQTNAQAEDSWKAQAFLNVYLPKGDGSDTRVKVGAIPLKASKQLEAAIIKRLTEDPESLQLMVNKLEYEFNLVDDPKRPAPVLPF